MTNNDNGEEMQMKITAGLGSIDEYERFVNVGADEFFLRLCAIRMDKEIWDGHATQSQGSSFL